MKEDFLHYLWKYKKFDTLNLKTYNNEDLVIINIGQYLELAGPDFFNAQVIIGSQKWAGNIEIHLKSSDWYLHHHEKDKAYENVILHVVWEHDSEIFNRNNSEVPVLILKNYVSGEIIKNYKTLIAPKSWIFCEKEIKDIDDFSFINWQERLFFERLERKSQPIYDLLELTNNDWEAVMFCFLAKNFGLNINGNSFLELALSIPFTIIRKESFEVENLEALLFGNAGLLDVDKEDNYFKDLKFRYFYLLHKYQLEKTYVEPMQFFKLRPDNFPTIRLSQLANLYYKHQNLFSKIIALKSVKEIYDLLLVSVAPYWQNHYQFDKISPVKTKKTAQAFVDLLIVNTVIPMQFAYAKKQGKTISEDLIAVLNEIKPEKNTIIDKFKLFKINAHNAFETQSLLQLKNEYCNKSRCLDCVVGMELLKGN
ncbi:DUF2851 family protein [Flavobacterium hydatis]|uniref:DUF2851 domain-containing protein n=1 Tax=Flavobacterium hydatis TaxID=991 RepID=A0A086AQ00_FLAHY|nr:DUF2851 family protein [Flavobacterium hydatis]KFF18764.1 hypothetical protein IW20_04125 [Flavobacterium hydatis]OXA88818.1 hypothetical protein B0A62_21500 [Flavobacterium hydatis]